MIRPDRRGPLTPAPPPTSSTVISATRSVVSAAQTTPPTHTRPQREGAAGPFFAALWAGACSLFAGTAAAATPAAPTDDDRPNIVVIVADDMVPRDLGCYGGHVPTPHIDSLARTGLRMDRAYCTSSMCTPSRYSLMTGRYPGRCADPRFLERNPVDEPYSITWNTHLTGDTPTVGHFLSNAGYDTAFVGKWHLGGAQPHDIDVPELPWDADPSDPQIDADLRRYQAALREGIRRDAGFERSGAVLWGNYDGPEGVPIKELRWHKFGWMADAASTLIAERTGDPLFLYAAVTSIHGPGHTESLQRDQAATPGGTIPAAATALPGADDIRKRLARHGIGYQHRAAAIVQLDDFVGSVLRELETADLRDDSIVIVTADHGAEPGKCGPYEVGNRVPFIVSWPGRIPSGSTDAVFSLVDLPATLVAAARGDAGGLHPDGVDQLPTWLGQRPSSRDYAFIETGYARAVTDGEYKYVALRYPDRLLEQTERRRPARAPDHFNLSQPTQTRIVMSAQPAYFDADQLYDLASDPYEQTNLAAHAEHAATLDRMQDALFRITATFEHPFPRQPHKIMSTKWFLDLGDATRQASRDATGLPWWDRNPRPWPPRESH